MGRRLINLGLVGSPSGAAFGPAAKRGTPAPARALPLSLWRSWPAPPVLDRHIGKGRKHQAESLRRLLDGAHVVGEHRVDGPSGTSAAAAERNPAVWGGPEVTQRGAEVADQLTARPADLFDPPRRRCGKHDVAAPRDQPLVELRPPDAPCVHAEHGMLRSNSP